MQGPVLLPGAGGGADLGPLTARVDAADNALILARAKVDGYSYTYFVDAPITSETAGDLVFIDGAGTSTVTLVDGDTPTDVVAKFAALAAAGLAGSPIVFAHESTGEPEWGLDGTIASLGSFVLDEGASDAAAVAAVWLTQYVNLHGKSIIADGRITAVETAVDVGRAIAANDIDMTEIWTAHPSTLWESGDTLICNGVVLEFYDTSAEPPDPEPEADAWIDLNPLYADTTVRDALLAWGGVTNEFDTYSEMWLTEEFEEESRLKIRGRRGIDLVFAGTGLGSISLAAGTVARETPEVVPLPAVLDQHDEQLAHLWSESSDQSNRITALEAVTGPMPARIVGARTNRMLDFTGDKSIVLTLSGTDEDGTPWGPQGVYFGGFNLAMEGSNPEIVPIDMIARHFHHGLVAFGKVDVFVVNGRPVIQTRATGSAVSLAITDYTTDVSGTTGFANGTAEGSGGLTQAQAIARILETE